jgi:hypothetical protein
MLDPARDQIWSATDYALKISGLQGASFVHVHQISTTQRPSCTDDVPAHGYGVQGWQIGNPLGQGFTPSGNETLPPALSSEAADQKFSLTFAAAKTFCEVNVGDKGRWPQTSRIQAR